MTLDASVLMPAIVDGHPLRSVFQPVLERLRSAATETGGQVAIIAPLEFLNEVITHRQHAIREVESRNLENPNNLAREALVFGAENLNVFVSAYATAVGRPRKKVSFREFLGRVAPYDNEEKLQEFLRRRGIEVEKLAQSDRPTEFWEWYNPLKNLYEIAEEWGGRRKAAVLVEHEAWQLDRLSKDHNAGIRSVFVTADGRLRRGVATIRDGRLADALLSGVAMTNLIDLLLGVKVDHRGLARLLWGVHAVDPSGTLRRYFTDLGLKEQGDIQTRVLPQVVDLIMDKVNANVAFRALPVMASKETERAEVAKFLDRFEDDFYRSLEAAVKDWEAKHDATSEGSIKGKKNGRHVHARRYQRKK